MRLIILFYFVIFHQSPICLCFDVQLEGKVEFGNDFMEKLQKAAFSSNLVQRTDNKADPAKSLRSGPSEIVDDDLTKYGIDKQTDIKNKTKATLAGEKNLIKHIKQQVVTEGESKFNSFGLNILNHLNSTLDLYFIMQNVSETYVNDIYEYIDHIGKQQMNNKIEREFFILDIVETSNKFFSQMCKIIFENIITRLAHNVPKENDITLQKLMHTVIVEEKKQNLKYVCEKLHICRYFPSYSDHAVILLKEILKLSDRRVEIIVTQLKYIIGQNMTKLFETIIDDDTKDIILAHLKPVLESVQAARSFLTTLENIISQRFKIYRSVGGEIKIRKKAVRILIDMVDKAFETLESDVIGIEFDIVLNGLKAWAIGPPSNNGGKEILTEYCANLADVLGFYWSADSKEEAKALIETIATGRPKFGLRAFEDLFSLGSKFIREVEP